MSEFQRLQREKEREHVRRFHVLAKLIFWVWVMVFIALLLHEVLPTLAWQILSVVVWLFVMRVLWVDAHLVEPPPEEYPTTPEPVKHVPPLPPEPGPPEAPRPPLHRPVD